MTEYSTFASRPRIRARLKDSESVPFRIVARTIIALLVIGAAAAFLSGCALDTAYVAADRLTFNKVGPAFRVYVQDDETLDEKQKARRFGTVDGWEARIEEGESE